MRARDAQLLRRTGSAPDSVPVMMAAAIDAWLEALDVFAQEALQPERGELMRRIKAQHSKTAVARDAFEAEDHR